MTICPQRFLDPNGFLMVLGDFKYVNMASDLVEILVDFWNGEMAMPTDTITPECPLPNCKVRMVPWYSLEHQAMKQLRRQSE